MLLSLTRRLHSHLLTLRATLHTSKHHSSESESEETAPQKKPYLHLFQDFEQEVVVPESTVLKSFRSRRIAQIMANNHAATESRARLLEAHIECLHSLLSRTEPSIEAISMFVEYVHHPHPGLLIVSIAWLAEEGIKDRVYLYSFCPHLDHQTGGHCSRN